MRIVVTLEDIRAYAEVDYIIHHMNQRYIDMLPYKLLNFFDRFKDPDWEIRIDPKYPLQEQGLMKYSLEIIAVLHVKYWCANEERKQELLKIMKENEERSDEAIRAKYNVENVFATQSITSVVTEDDLEAENVTEEDENDVTDFSKPRSATILNEVQPIQESVPEQPVEDPKEEVKPEDDIPDFRKPSDREVTAGDIVNSSVQIDYMPIKTDEQKKNSIWQKLLNLFKIGKK